MFAHINNECLYWFHQLLENIKHTQVAKYNRATDEEKLDIECDPLVIFKQAVENVKPLLLTTRVVKGGTAYRVSLYWTVNDHSLKVADIVKHDLRSFNF